MTSSHSRDMIEVLTHDHREVEDMFTRLETLGIGDSRNRKDLVDQVTIELIRHSVAEEQYLYPTVRTAIPDGNALADMEMREHAEAEQLLKDLESLDAADPRFEPLLEKLIADVRKHINHEEQVLFTELAGRCGTDELIELGEKITRAKKVAPTRPHPSAPDTPPANKVVGPVVGLVDRMRDALAGRGKD